jgi:tRNA 2-selenouridine synthase
MRIPVPGYLFRSIAVLYKRKLLKGIVPQTVNISEFLALARQHPILDVRTPAEFDAGHIPGARNLPLFTSEERAIVGTLYKREGRQAAILKGLEIVGPKMKDMVKAAGKISSEGIFLMHCWRGGMRSGSVAWLLDLYGYKVYTLRGGYKSYRKLALEVFNEPRKIVVLGGRTGAGKTLILDELRNQGEQVLDLEQLANHKGSSFGGLGEEKQPTQEQFENELAFQLLKSDPSKQLWIEDESRTVGSKVIPDGIWKQMRESKVMYVDIPFEVRSRYLTRSYGKYDPLELKAAIERIGKRLGGQHVKRAIEAIDNGDLQTACEISLAYYDNAYDHGLNKRDASSIHRIAFDRLDPAYIAKELIGKG